MAPGVLVGVLLARSAAAAGTCPAPGNEESRCIELVAAGLAEAPDIQLSPGYATTFVFDSDVRTEGTTWEDRNVFTVSELGRRTLTLMPSEWMRAKKTQVVKVCFADGQAPVCTTFRLSFHPTKAERQVNVFRHPRSVESLEQELRQLREECNRPRGLTGLVASGLLNAQGIVCTENENTQGPEDALRVRNVRSCRAPERMAVWLQLRNTSESPWRPGETTWVGAGGEAWPGSVWPPETISPGQSTRLFLEVEIPRTVTGIFTVKLGESDGPRVLTLERVTFPALAETPER